MMIDHISASDLQGRYKLTRQQVLKLAEAGYSVLHNCGHGRYHYGETLDDREYIENGFQSLKQIVVSDWSNLSHRFENEPDERWNNYIYERFPEDISGKIANKLLGENCPEVIQRNLNNDYSMRDIVSMMANKRMINLFYIPEPWLANRETIWAYLSKQPSIAIDLYFVKIFESDLFFHPDALQRLHGVSKHDKENSKAVACDPSNKKTTKRDNSSQKKLSEIEASQDEKNTITTVGMQFQEKKDESPRRWLTTKEAAKYLNCSENFLEKDRITMLHGIPFVRLGRKIKYDIFELDKYLGKTIVGVSKK